MNDFKLSDWMSRFRYLLPEYFDDVVWSEDKGVTSAVLDKPLERDRQLLAGLVARTKPGKHPEEVGKSMHAFAKILIQKIQNVQDAVSTWPVERARVVSEAYELGRAVAMTAATPDEHIAWSRRRAAAANVRRAADQWADACVAGAAAERDALEDGRLPKKARGEALDTIEEAMHAEPKAKGHHKSTKVRYKEWCKKHPDALPSEAFGWPF